MCQSAVQCRNNMDCLGYLTSMQMNCDETSFATEASVSQSTQVIQSTRLGEKLRDLRKARQLTFEKLAELAGLSKS